MSAGKETVDVTPTWKTAMSIYLAVLRDGTQKGKEEARQGLMELAGKMDWANDTVGKLMVALKETHDIAFGLLPKNPRSIRNREVFSLHARLAQTSTLIHQVEEAKP